MAIAAEELISQIDEMSVLELNGLVKVLEEHYGVSAAAAAGPAAVAGGGEAAAAEDIEVAVVVEIDGLRVHRNLDAA